MSGHLESLHPSPEEIQRIAEICGEFSMAGCGIVQYRAQFPPWPGDETPPKVQVIEPEKVEGLFHAIWTRLKMTPGYQPLAAAEERTRQATAQWIEAEVELHQMRALVAEAERRIAHLSGQGDTQWRTDFRRRAGDVEWGSRLDGWPRGRPGVAEPSED